MTKKALRFISLFFIICALVLVLYNLNEARKAYEYSKDLMAEIEKVQNMEKPFPNEENKFPIPTINVDGIEIIGNLEIPKLNIKLPITANWDYELMKKYPNRYMGNNYNEPLIIMAHNYKKHFGNLNKLEKDDDIIFTDALGRNINYKVKVREVIDGKDIESMINTNYDLTLFTCTLDSASRVTIRANRFDFKEIQ